MDQVILKVNGLDYFGWTSVNISSSLTAISRTFTVESSRAQNSQFLKFGIKPGDAVEVFLGTQILLTGYVSKVILKYSNNSISLSVQGVSKTADIVDSSLPSNSVKTFKKMRIKQILEKVVQHLGIEVVEEVPITDIETINFSPDDLIASKFVDLLKRKSFLLTDNEKGQLVISRVGTLVADDEIALGKNVLSGELISDHRLRFGEYAVYGQGTNPDSTRPLADNQIVGVALDSSVRPKTRAVKQTGNATLSDVKARANAICLHSIGSSNLSKYSLIGWRQSTGELWKINQLVKVNDPLLDIFSTKIISKVTYSMSNSGKRVDVELVDPKAFLFTEGTSSAEKSTMSSSFKRIGVVSDKEWVRQ